MKKIKKLYIPLLLMSILGFASEQIMASWRKKAAGSAAVAGTALASYYSNNQSLQSINPIINQPSNLGIKMQPKYNAPSYMYANMQKNQFGAAGLQAATKKLLDNMDIEDQNDDEDDSIEGLSWSQLSSDNQRIAYLHNSLGADVATDFNDSLIVHYLVSAQTNDQQYDLFVKKLHEYARQDRSETITMSHVDKAFAYMVIDEVNQAMGRSIIGRDDQDAVDWLLWSIKIKGIIMRNIFGMDHKKQLETAWHEAAHALQAACAEKLSTVSQLSVEPQGLAGGAFIAVPQCKPKIVHSAKDFFHGHQEKLDRVKSKIKIALAGGVGEMILEDKKLSFSEFEKRYEGIGNPNLVGSDIWQIVQELKYLYLYKDLTVVADFEKELEPYARPSQAEFQEYADALLEECYEETYANLYANKPMLDQIVKEALKHGVISGDRIYELAGKKRPKYDFEMSATEKVVKALANWLSWTFNRMAFYNRHGEQS